MRNSTENMMKNKTFEIINRCLLPLFEPAPPSVSTRYTYIMRKCLMDLANVSSLVNNA